MMTEYIQFVGGILLLALGFLCALIAVGAFLHLSETDKPEEKRADIKGILIAVPVAAVLIASGYFLLNS